MRKVTETRVERIETKTEVFCDLCGKQKVAPNTDCFDQTQADIVVKEGSYYPEGDCRTATYADVCAECFREKAMPALQAIGVKFYKSCADEYS